MTRERLFVGEVSDVIPELLLSATVMTARYGGRHGLNSRIAAGQINQLTAGHCAAHNVTVKVPGALVLTLSRFGARLIVGRLPAR